MCNPPVIEEWHWEITRNCNQHCAHCLIGGLEVGELSTEAALRVITKMTSFGGKRLYITGGEPFVRNDLRLLVCQARAIGLSVNIITNGILQDVIMPFVNDGLIDRIGVSIDGNEYVHDLIRGHGSYRTTVSTLKAIIGAGSSVTAYLTISSLSINYLGAVMSELIDLGVESFHLNEINRAGRVTTNRYLEINGLSKEDVIEKISSQLEPLIEMRGFSVDCSCAISPGSAYVDFGGRVYACAELAMNGREAAIATLPGNDFAELFQKYHSEVKIPGTCRYSTYRAPGLDICLNASSSCVLRKEF